MNYLLPMESGQDQGPLIFDYEYLHIRVERGVFELFNLHASQHSFRIPLRWLGVTLRYKKPDRPGKVYFGTVLDQGAALYDTDPQAFRFSTCPALEVPPGDERLFREFFTEVARLADRPVG